MRTGPGGLVDEAVDNHTVRGNVEDGHLRGMGRVGGRVGEDGGRSRLSTRDDCGERDEGYKKKISHKALLRLRDFSSNDSQSLPQFLVHWLSITTRPFSGCGGRTSCG